MIYSCSIQKSIPDYHQMHQNYLHMDFQVYGMMGGPQIPKEARERDRHCQEKPPSLEILLKNRFGV